MKETSLSDVACSGGGLSSSRFSLLNEFLLRARHHSGGRLRLPLPLNLVILVVVEENVWRPRLEDAKL